MSKRPINPGRWTDEQWQAIVERGQNLLVAAAAGSGKTAVLVERMIRKVTDTEEPVGVDELLVVTFTNAAAAEMRHRIGDALHKALESDPTSHHLRRQLALLPRATITTLHSFCLNLLRQHYYAVELDPDFRIADQMEAALLRQDVLEEKFEEWYERDEAFAALADTMLDGQDDQALATLFLRVYDFSRSHPKPTEWLKQAAEMFDLPPDAPLTSLPWTRSLLVSLQLELKAIEMQLGRAVELASLPEGPNAYTPLLEQERAAVTRARDVCEGTLASPATETWETLAEAVVFGVTFARLPAVKHADKDIQEQVKAMRDGVKKKLGKLEEDYFSATATGYYAGLREAGKHMQTLAHLVITFGEAFYQAKQARSIVDFSDLEHLALRLLRAETSTETDDSVLRPSPIAVGLREQFAEVLVDEYQDINTVQETLLAMVSRDATADVAANRFMVGDVKQSIYRFRLAEPKLFLGKYESYPKAHDPTHASDANGLRIDLAANFRSRSEVVDAVNFLFRQIMSPGVGEIDYDRSAELVCRAPYTDVDDLKQLDVEVHLIDKKAPETEEGEAFGADADAPETANAEANSDNPEEATTAQLEARVIARRIREWMEPGEGGQPLLVYDKQKQKMRKVEYRDIVILLRATSVWAQSMMDEFKQADIPTYVEQSDGYFSATEVEIMLSLLRIIDNPKQDIPLAAVLRSPIVGLHENELAEIRIQHPKLPFHQAVEVSYQETKRKRDETPIYDRDGEHLSSKASEAKLIHFYQSLHRWRTQARRGSLTDLLSLIYRDTAYVDFVASLENGQQRQANLRILYDRARQYEATSYRGLFRFLRFIDRMQEQQSDFGEARTIGESENVVRIMTIHKSKGLEFPVVFAAGLGKRFNTMDIQGSFLLHKDLGFGPQVVDTTLRLRYPSLAQLGIKQLIRREMLAEEMRVLYVALTRAREKLILVGTASNLKKSIQTWCHQSATHERLADEDLLQAKGYLDWVGRALVRHKAGAALLEHAQGEHLLESPKLIVDDSRWQFAFYQASEVSADVLQVEWDEALWQQICERKAIAERERDGAQSWHAVVDKALGWKYRYDYATKIAAKQSVSDLKQQKREMTSTTESRPNKLPTIAKQPRFLTQSQASGETTSTFSATDIGTLMHLFMQHVDVSGSLDETDLRAQLERLTEREFLTVEAAAQVNLEAIATFFSSALGQRMKHATKIYRELPFTMALPVTDVYPEVVTNMHTADQQTGLDSEKVIVQGIIDCLLEEADGSFVLIDFKTDRFSGETINSATAKLHERYHQQLRLYQQAIEQITKRSLKECYLYSFSLNIVVPLA